MRILLADHSEQMLRALKYALVNEPYVQVVAEVRTLESLAVAAAEHLPDLVLLDWQLAKADSKNVIASLHQLRPVLTVFAMVVYLEDGRAALAAGADAIVSKGESPGWLLATVRKLVTKPGTNPIEEEPL